MRKLNWSLIVDILILAVLVAMFVSEPSHVNAQLAASSGFQTIEITTNSCTIVKQAGMLDRIFVDGAGSAWTLQVFDNSSACSGTAVIGATAITVPTAGTDLQFDIQTVNGIAIKTAGTTAGELTITYR